MKKRAVLIVVITFCVGVLYFSRSIIIYPLATYQYERLVELDPPKRADVEKQLHFYRAKPININDSFWGKGLELKSGEYCISYLILGSEPIDVIYDSNDKVIHIMSSFE